MKKELYAATYGAYFTAIVLDLTKRGAKPDFKKVGEAADAIAIKAAENAPYRDFPNEAMSFIRGNIDDT